MSLPYFEPAPLNLRGVGLGSVSWFSIMAALGVFTALWAYDRLLSRHKPEAAASERLLMIAMVSVSFLSSFWGQIAFYRPDWLAADAWVWLKPWTGGFSAVTGFYGAIAAAWIFMRITRRPVFPALDLAWLALGIGWIPARIGCFLVHDHPGVETSFFMGMVFPDGVMRHDLGLYELLLMGLVCVPATLFVARRPWRNGTLFATIVLLYSPARFLLDFLRASDARWLGLTPAQYGLVPLIFLGIWVVIAGRPRDWPVQPALWGKRK